MVINDVSQELQSFFKTKGSMHEVDNESDIDNSVLDLEKIIRWSTHVLVELFQYLASSQLPFKKFMNVCLNDIS
jgi:hypothetical protein